MNFSTKALALFFLVFTSVKSFSQATANASASATIVTPIALSSDQNINFGNIAVQSSTGGTVVLASDGTRTRTNGVTLPATSTGSPTPARFTVTGVANNAFTITLPSSISLAGPSGSTPMTANNFTASIATDGTATLDNSGSRTFTVGATLTVAAGQTVGSYTTSSPFSVTVNYN